VLSRGIAWKKQDAVEYCLLVIQNTFIELQTTTREDQRRWSTCPR